MFEKGKSAYSGESMGDASNDALPVSGAASQMKKKKSNLPLIAVGVFLVIAMGGAFAYKVFVINNRAPSPQGPISAPGTLSPSAGQAAPPAPQVQGATTAAAPLPAPEISPQAPNVAAQPIQAAKDAGLPSPAPVAQAGAPAAPQAAPQAAQPVMQPQTQLPVVAAAQPKAEVKAPIDCGGQDEPKAKEKAKPKAVQHKKVVQAPLKKVKEAVSTEPSSAAPDGGTARAIADYETYAARDGRAWVRNKKTGETSVVVSGYLIGTSGIKVISVDSDNGIIKTTAGEIK
jgi:hypothetical protein